MSAGLVVRWPGCWDSAADTTAFVAGSSVGLAAGFEAYSRCSRSWNCCHIFASPSPCFCKRFRPSQHTCLRLKSCPPQRCRRRWKPRLLFRPATLARMLRFLARSSSAACKRIYFRSTRRIDPTAPWDSTLDASRRRFRYRGCKPAQRFAGRKGLQRKRPVCTCLCTDYRKPPALLSHTDRKRSDNDRMNRSVL